MYRPTYTLFVPQKLKLSTCSLSQSGKKTLSPNIKTANHTRNTEWNAVIIRVGFHMHNAMTDCRRRNVPPTFCTRCCIATAWAVNKCPFSAYNQRRSVSLWVAGHLIKFCDDWTTAIGRPRRRWYVVHWFPEDTTHLSYSVNGRCCCGCCADSQQSRSRYLGDVANTFDCICISHLEHLAAIHASLRFCLFSINVCTLEKSVRLYC